MASRFTATGSARSPAWFCQLTSLCRPAFLPAFLMAFALLVACGSGCGRRVPHGNLPWAEAKVTVRVGADPLAVGEVAFLAEQDSTGTDAGGVVDAKGTVTIPVLPGAYTVVIRPLPPSEEEMAKPRTAPKAATSIPGRFHSPKTSPFKATITARENREFTFDLSAPDSQ